MENLRKMGTSELVEIVNETGGWSNRNYTSGRDDKLSEHLDGFAIKEKLWDGGSRRRPCQGCASLATRYARFLSSCSSYSFSVTLSMPETFYFLLVL